MAVSNPETVYCWCSFEFLYRFNLTHGYRDEAEVRNGINTFLITLFDAFNRKCAEIINTLKVVLALHYLINGDCHQISGSLDIDTDNLLVII